MPVTLLLLLFAVGETPPAPPPLASPPPYWDSTPTLEDMDRVYPPEARAQGAGGRATLDCAIAPSGVVSDCRVAQESPGEQGFGAAALSLAPLLKMGVEARTDVRFADGRARIPLVWRVRDCPALLPSAGDVAPPTTRMISSWTRSEPVITRPDWVRKPNSDDMARFYPDHAGRNRIGGKSVINCKVTSQGSLTSCEVVSETPEDQDFGAAALKVTGKFRMRPMTSECESVEGATVRLPLTWSPPE